MKNIKYILVLMILAISGLVKAQDFGYEIIDYYSSNPTDEMDFFGDDVLLKNSWLPDENTGGLPSEIVYAPEVDKFYVYAGRNIIVIDGTTNSVIKRIEVSERGSVDWHGFPNSVYYNEQFNEKNIAYNLDQQCIYCATEDEKLVVIDCNSNSIVKTFKLNETVENIIVDIYYNELTQKLYWLVSGNNNKAILTIIDGSTNSFIDEIVYENLKIYKISGSQSGDRLFMSCNEYLFSITKVIILETDNYLEIDAVITNSVVTDFVYNNSDKIYLAFNNANQIGIITYNPSTNDYEYFGNIPTPNKNMLLCFNPVENRVFGCGGSGNGKLNIIDGIANTLITSIDIATPNALIYNTTNNTVFCAGSKLIKITGNSNTINAESITNLGGESRGLAFKESSGKILSANPTAGHVTIFDYSQPDPNIILEDYVQTGGSTYYGCYNSVNHKYYFIQNDSYSDNGFVNIYNAVTNTLINSLVLHGATYIRTCTFDEYSNKVFITAFSSNNIYVVSGDDDFSYEIIPDIQTPMRIESIPNTGKLICGGGSMIRFIDAVNYSILETIEVQNQAFADFLVSEFDPHIIYVSCLTTSPYSSIILKINMNDYSTESLPLTFAAGQLISDGNNLFVLTYNMSLNYDFYLGKISESSFTLIETTQVMRGSYDFVFNPFSKKVYILHRDVPELNLPGGLTIVDGNNINEIEIPGMHSPGMFFNPINNRIYFHTNYNPNSVEKESYLTSFDCTRESIESVVYLGQKHNYNESYYIMTFMSEEMVFNPDNNQLIFGNRGFSNISVIQCAWDKLNLNTPYTWLSFPRMPRYAFTDEPYSTVSVLKKISWFPTDLILESQLGGIKQYEHPNPGWSGPLDELYSTKGYKLDLSEIDPPAPSITLTGARLHPDVEVELFGSGQPTWIGYFIEESQYPKFAFPAYLYDHHLTLIQTQYWTMVKTPLGWLQTGKVTPIKYGEMVIVKTNLDQSVFFEWNDPLESEEDVSIPVPQAYTWEEKAAYTPFFVETDPASDIAEIAVKVDGMCMGATVRQPGDTLTEVDGYFEGLPAGAVVEFETWNGQKSTSVEKDGYVVVNPVTRVKEKRNIYIGETQDFYEVSLKAGEVYVTPDDISQVTCQPNPFTDETVITLRLNCSLQIRVDVYNMNGEKVKTLLEGELPGGYYEAKWNGDNETGSKVRGGVYFYRIKTGNGTEISEKIVLIK